MNFTDNLRETKRIQTANTLKLITFGFCQLFLAPFSMGIINGSVSRLKLTFSTMLLDIFSLPSDPSELTGTGREFSFYWLLLMFFPRVLQIHSKWLMHLSPHHLVLFPLFPPLLLFVFLFLKHCLLSFPVAVLHPLYSLHRSGVFKLGFVKILKIVYIEITKDNME